MTKHVYDAMIRKLTENNFTIHNHFCVYPSWAIKKMVDPCLCIWGYYILCYRDQITSISFNGDYITVKWQAWANHKLHNYSKIIHRKYLINML